MIVSSVTRASYTNNVTLISSGTGWASITKLM
jgi:hypothetical protein